MSDSRLLEAFIDLRPALHRYLLLRGALADEAEDILQEVGVRLADLRIDDADQPRAYLYRSVNNEFLVHRRSADRRSRRENDWFDVHRSTDQQPSAEAQLIAREQVAVLQRVLDELPERTRGIFRCFRVDGQSQREIAAQCAISVSAVEKHLARAYQAVASARLRLDADSILPRYLKDTKGRQDG